MNLKITPTCSCHAYASMICKLITTNLVKHIVFRDFSLPAQPSLRNFITIFRLLSITEASFWCHGCFLLHEHEAINCALLTSQLNWLITCALICWKDLASLQQTFLTHFQESIRKQWSYLCTCKRSPHPVVYHAWVHYVYSCHFRVCCLQWNQTSKIAVWWNVTGSSKQGRELINNMVKRKWYVKNK